MTILLLVIASFSLSVIARLACKPWRGNPQQKNI